MSIVNCQKSIVAKEKGIAILPVIIVVSAILAVLGITIGISSYLESQSGAAVEQSAKAEAAAWAGLNDALRQLANCRRFGDAAGPCPDFADDLTNCATGEYSLTSTQLGANTKACVAVTAGTDVDGPDADTPSTICNDVANEGRNTTIVVRGISGSRERRLRAEKPSAALCDATSTTGCWVKCNGDLDETNLLITEPTS